MKLYSKQSSLNHRRDDDAAAAAAMPNHSPTFAGKLHRPRALPRPVSYLLKEQRLLFVLVGILIATTFFLVQPTLLHLTPASDLPQLPLHLPAGDGRRRAYPDAAVSGAGGKNRIPKGLRRQPRRIVVTGGAGFVGSHLVDKLLERGDNVIVIDNFFTGRRENLMHHFGNPRFELLRHDVVEPILLEVDQIYHLACPASPVHYKYNPIKTIISFFFL